ncbi:MAG TPA: alpha/beta fold hydrolase [Candidatus Acidoferrales bacterium]|nr:alpha/beta fold hydrolase [Candidatus Acidoferrales bacterium]
MKKFTPLKPLRNGHLMTLAATFWRRKFPRLPNSESRQFQVEAGTKIRGECHWQPHPKQPPTLVLVHGLEGSSESGYILGTAEKAWVAGFNVIRLNQRNCGGTENLTETLYHSGLSRDFRAAVLELVERDELTQIFVAGFSMGGNLVLKMAGEFADATPPQINGFAAVAPSMDLASCAAKLEERANFLYQLHFVTRLKRRMRHKASLFPETYKIEGMRNIRTVRDFDDLITARYCGFRSAADYYAQSSAAQFLGKIRKPTLIIAAQDDPVVPFAAFQNGAVHANPNIKLLATKHGGHCAFIAEEGGDERFWSEARIVEFCKELAAGER